jgi:hypothetical protein
MPTTPTYAINVATVTKTKAAVTKAQVILAI